MAHRLAAVLVVVIIIGAVGTFGYRRVYGTWWQTPERIPYCGRTYLRGAPALSQAEIQKNNDRLSPDGQEADDETSADGVGQQPVVTVATVPPIIGRPLLAAVTPVAARRESGLPCAMAVYLKTSPDAYTAYGLSGGP